MKQTRGKIIIVGGSLGGLLAANLLHRDGWDVHVYEKAADELAGRGAGIVTHPELLQVLALAGVKVDNSIGVQVESRRILSRSGRVESTVQMPQVLTAWSRLYSGLRAAFPDDRYHAGKSFEDVTQTEEGVTAVFSDGTRRDADLLVGADGIRSAVRRLFLPSVNPEYAGYIAWRGIVEDERLPPEARADLMPYFSFGLPPREQMVAYPVAGAGGDAMRDSRRFNFVWYRPADQTTVLRELLTDATGKVWADGIPPPLIRKEVLVAARQAAHEVLAPQFADAVGMTENLFFQPIVDLESTGMAFGRVATLGDAAFVARPHCGMGVTKAGGDALALRDALTKHGATAKALRAYEAARLGYGSLVVRHGRKLGAYMQAQLKSDAEREFAEKFRHPETVLNETAVPFTSTASSAH